MGGEIYTVLYEGLDLLRSKALLIDRELRLAHVAPHNNNTAASATAPGHLPAPHCHWYPSSAAKDRESAT